MKRFGGTVTAAVVLSLLASSCGSGISEGSGKAIAGHARRDVATVYWKLYNALGQTVIRTNGSGRFVSCAGSGSNSLRYAISTAISGLSSRQGLPQFTDTVRSSFSSVGWGMRGGGQNSAGQSLYSASKRGIDITLRAFKDNLGPGAALTVDGTCVNVGSAASPILSAYEGSVSDQYPAAEASASPIPTSFAPSG